MPWLEAWRQVRNFARKRILEGGHVLSVRHPELPGSEDDAESSGGVRRCGEYFNHGGEVD